MHKHFFNLVLFSILFAGCAVEPVQTPQSNITRLTTLLYALDRQTSRQESKQLSQSIFRKTAELTDEFELTSPPLWHNFLVNVGLRKKGLCFHWSDTLYLYLKRQGYRDFSFHLVGANIGEYFLEHNALVIASKDGKVEEGIIIDPWRNSGKLYFSKVKEDKAYKWTHRLDRGCTP